MWPEQRIRYTGFLRKQGFDHLQFIPCMDPLGGKEKSAYSLSGEEYGDFLCRIFDLWYDELCRGEQVWIRQFDNYVDMLSGYEPEACDMRGRCGKNYVIEADGSVYPCDFYALDQWKIGDIKQEGWEEIDRNREKKGFSGRDFSAGGVPEMPLGNAVPRRLSQIPGRGAGETLFLCCISEVF